MAELLTCETAGRVAVVTLSNPPLNLVTLELTQRLSDHLDRLAELVEINVVILTGAGDSAFCAGSDIKEFPQLHQDGTFIEKKLAFENEVFTKLDRFPKCTIAALNGLAYGGGLELAACCDLIVAEKEVKLALPEILLGTFPGSGGTIRVPHRIGEARSKQMMFLGDPISAATALDWGLINYVVPKGQALAEARLLAERLATRAQLSIALCKKSIDESFWLDDDTAVARSLEYSREVFAHPNTLEGVTAFFAKRTPVFDRGIHEKPKDTGR